jgi:hypothetical protein
LLQIEAVPAAVARGVGFTVTVIVKGAPTQPFADVGVTTYRTVPAVVVLGFANTWLIRLPVPLLAPVMPPVPATAVQTNVLVTVAPSEIFGLVLSQIATVGELVIAGFGFTVTVMV